jgi:hypothetical protein
MRVAKDQRLRVGLPPLAKAQAIWYNAWCRGVAQPGSALEWGSSGRPFESGRPDHACPILLAFRSLGYGRSGGRYPNSLCRRRYLPPRFSPEGQRIGQ